MTPKLITNTPKLIFDNIATNYFTLNTEINQIKEYPIIINDFKYFNELKKKLPNTEYIKIISELTTCNESEFFKENYLGTENLPLKFNFDGIKKLLVIISHGEIQPGRFKCYLEGVWELFD